MQQPKDSYQLKGCDRAIPTMWLVLYGLILIGTVVHSLLPRVIAVAMQ